MSLPPTSRAISWADLPLVLRVEEAAGVLGLSTSSTYQAIRTGALPGVRVGRRLVVPRDALRRLLEENGAPASNGGATEGVELRHAQDTPQH